MHISKNHDGPFYLFLPVEVHCTLNIGKPGPAVREVVSSITLMVEVGWHNCLNTV